MEETTEERCGLCKSTKYLNPKLKILTSPCYHRMCDSCVERLFGHGPAPCPFCKTALRKNNFVLQTFEDLVVERECQIRKTLQKYMNKVEEDFSSLRAYNDYLELVEDYTFRLLNTQNVQQVYAELEQFRMANKDEIHRNMMRQMQQDKAIQQLIEAQDEGRKRRQAREHEQEEEQIKEQEKEQAALLEEVTKSDQPASLLLARRVRRAQPSTALKPSSARSLLGKEDKIALDSSLGGMYDDVEDALKDCYQFPVSFILMEKYPFDPALDGWVLNPVVRAGGCLPALFHLKAIQASFILS